MSAFAQLPSILVVEDNQKDLELLQHRFRDAHLMNPVRIVRNGLEATRYLAGEGEYKDRQLFPLPGIVILDLHLPKLDGFEVLSWIRSRTQFKNLPVVVLTSQAEDPHMERARSCGADAFLIKGLDTDGLIELLKNASLGWALVPTHGELNAA